MSQSYNSQMHNPPTEATVEMDFLTPEQRCDAIAAILADIAIRIVKAGHAKDKRL